MNNQLPSIRPKMQNTYHRDGSVSYWNILSQCRERRLANQISDAVMATFTKAERERIAKATQ